MSLHIFGAIVTGFGCAANNRGETEGNITTLQKLLWGGQVHTTVSAEAIRWALRYYWQTAGNESEINRIWDDEKNDFLPTDPDYKAWHPEHPVGEPCWDDDLFGFMEAAAGNEESELQHEIPRRISELQKKIDKKPDDVKAKKNLEKFNETIKKLKNARAKLNQADEVGDETEKKKIGQEINKLRKSAQLKSLAVVRRGVLEIARAISTTPYAGDISFNAKSGEKGRTSLYGTEIHATRYQYGFAMTPERLRVKKRCIDALNALGSLGEVAGNHSRFLFDFSPESIVLRISEDPAPRILYCFDEVEGKVTLSDELIRKVDSSDILPEELFIGGLIADLPEVKSLKAKVCEPGIKQAVKECNATINNKLRLEN